jgi:hypothetical protein
VPNAIAIATIAGAIAVNAATAASVVTGPGIATGAAATIPM